MRDRLIREWAYMTSKSDMEFYDRCLRAGKKPQDMEKEMEPKFKVGDKVVTPRGELGVVSDFTSLMTAVIVKIRRARHALGVFEKTTWNQLWAPDKLRHANIYDEAGERWRSALSNICYSARYISAMEKAVREAYQAPPQPIFRLKHNNGSSGWEGCHFVLVAEDEHELLVKEVDINEAKVRDRVMTLQKSNWTRDYSIGDDIINFLSARGGNFTNKVVDNG